LFEGTIDEVKKEYGKTPESSAADGGYASGANIKYGQEAGINKKSPPQSGGVLKISP
jgi:hypothetical protein